MLPCLAVYRDIDQYDFRMSRAFTLVLMYIGIGARNKRLQPIVLNYLVVRDAWLRSHKAQSDALFFAMNRQYSFLSGNSIRKIKKIVEKAVGEEFELRNCRRAYGQYCLNKGVEIDSVSVLMGHETTRTTELYYCRKEEDKAMEAVREVW